MRNAYNIKKTIAILVALLALISCAKDLSAVTSDSSDEARTAKDGWTITGMLPVKKSIFIADGATVTLNEVSINANEAWNDGEGAGTGNALTALVSVKQATAERLLSAAMKPAESMKALHLHSVNQV